MIMPIPSFILALGFALVLPSILLVGCGSGIEDNADVFGQQALKNYEMHTGLNCNAGHGSDINYELHGLSVQQCVDACSGEFKCGGVSVQRDGKDAGASTDEPIQACWLLKDLDMSKCTSSDDHELWYRIVPEIPDSSDHVMEPLPKKVADGEDCWLPCGEKSGYCAACKREANVWRACCREGLDDPICNRASRYPFSLAAGQYQCVDVDYHHFPGGLPWMQKLETIFEHAPPTASNAVNFYPGTMVCNKMEIDRFSLQVRDSKVLIDAGGLSTKCEQHGKLVIVGGWLGELPIKIDATMLHTAVASAEIHLPQTTWQVTDLGMDACTTTFDFDIDMEVNGWDIPDYVWTWLSGLSEDFLSEQLTNVMCMMLNNSVQNKFNPQLREILASQKPWGLDSSEDCFHACGDRPGWCLACGPNRACCRRDSAYGTEECSKTIGIPSEDRYECVEASLPKPWMQSFVYQPVFEPIPFMLGITLKVQDVTCGNGNFNSVLFDMHQSGFSGHLTGLDFTIECSAQLSMLGQVASVQAIIQPGFHGRFDMDTPDMMGQGFVPSVRECRARLPLHVRLFGHWARWPLNGLLNLLEGTIQESLETRLCEQIIAKGQENVKIWLDDSIARLKFIVKR